MSHRACQALVLIFLLFTGCSSTNGQDRLSLQSTVKVAAAADLRFALEEIRQQFALTSKGAGVSVNVVYGSSGKLYEQIRNGAPFDLFLAADDSYPKRLASESAISEDRLFVYASGRIGVHARDHSLSFISTHGITALADPLVGRVAIADPLHAPYGRAAVQALEKYGLLAKIEPKLAKVDNASHALGLVQTGGADAGIVPVSLLSSPEASKGQVWLVPATAHDPLIQTGVFLIPRDSSPEVTAFADFVASPEGYEILSKYGFDPPPRQEQTS